MFVQRDLTYKQRSELVAKRAQNFSGRSGPGPVQVGRLGAGVDGCGVPALQGAVSRGRGGYGGLGRGSGGRGSGVRGRGSGGRGRGSGFGDRGRGSGGRGGGASERMSGSDSFRGRGGGSGAGGNAFNANHQMRNLNC